jgi:hypothetical protein
MKTMRQRIKEVQDREKSYVDVHHVDCSYEVFHQNYGKEGAHGLLTSLA